MPGLVLDNGSGLSREERISAYDMARLLQQALASDVGYRLVDSLPILGVDGTLRNRLTRAHAAGNAYLKTGTLADVRALAGYSRCDQRRSVCGGGLHQPPERLRCAGSARCVDGMGVSRGALIGVVAH